VDNLHNRQQLYVSFCGVLPNRGSNNHISTLVG
jgi:hypothetical protein